MLEKLKTMFYYDNGDLYRLIGRRGSAKAGDLAGTVQPDGYRYIKLGGKIFLAHRLIFLFHHGYYPEHGVDHIDRNKLNNKIENLREATQQCNVRNSDLSRRNLTGVKGVSNYKHCKNQWKVSIMINGIPCRLGTTFKCFTEAVAHRLAAEQAVNWDGCDSTSTAFLHMKHYLETIV